MKFVHPNPRYTMSFKGTVSCCMMAAILLWSSTGLPSSSSSPNMTLSVPPSAATMASIVRVSAMCWYAVDSYSAPSNRIVAHATPCSTSPESTEMWRSSLNRLECSGERPSCCSARNRCQRRRGWRGRRSFLLPMRWKTIGSPLIKS